MNNVKKDELEETLAKIWQYFDFHESSYTIHSIKKDLIIATKMMKEHFSKLGKDEEVLATGEEKTIVKTSLNSLMGIVLDIPINRNFAMFIGSYCLLAKNWNDNVGNRPDIGHMVEFIDRSLTQHLTICEAIEVLKVLIQKSRRLENYAFPALNLSKHYFETLKEEVSGAAKSVTS